MPHEDPHSFTCTRFVTICGVPPVLHVNKESRQEALKHYTLSFGSKHVLHHGFEVSTPPRIYVNLKRDVICPMAVMDYRPNWHLELLQTPGLSRIALNIVEMDHEDAKAINLSESCLSLKEILLYHLEEPFTKTSFPFYEDQFEVDFRDLAMDKAGLPGDLAEHFGYFEGTVLSEHAMALEFELLDSKLDDSIDFENSDEIWKAMELEMKEIERRRPEPIVRFSRILVNGIDLDEEE